MFRIKWMTHFSEIGMIDTDDSIIESDLDRLVYSCIEKLRKMRMIASGQQPDGFVISNEEGSEVRRWFDSPSPSQKTARFHIQSSPAKIVFFSDETTTWCKTIPNDLRRLKY
jgi:hypothetical protein